MTSSKPPLEARNEGSEWRVGWLRDVERAAADAAERAFALVTESPQGPSEVRERLLAVVRLLDLTSLDDADTDETVRRLCARARRPLAPVAGDAAGRTPGPSVEPEVEVAAVCVHDRFVSLARQALSGSGVRVAAVTAGFPLPWADRSRRLAEIQAAVEAGADEVDVVVSRRHALDANWRALYDEVVALREACGPSLLKAILEGGALGSLDTVAKAGFVCCMAGADFIKTSTGRERVSATLPMGVAMSAAIRCHADRTGQAVGLKPAGGIRTADQALSWLRLGRTCLGEEWLTPRRFRMGASSLLDALEQALGDGA